MSHYRVTARVAFDRWTENTFLETLTVPARDADEAALTALQELLGRYGQASILTASRL